MVHLVHQDHLGMWLEVSILSVTEMKGKVALEQLSRRRWRRANENGAEIGFFTLKRGDGGRWQVEMQETTAALASPTPKLRQKSLVGNKIYGILEVNHQRT